MGCYNIDFINLITYRDKLWTASFRTMALVCGGPYKRTPLVDEYPISKIDLCMSLATLLLPQALESVLQQNIVLLLGMYKLSHSVALTVHQL